MNHKELLSKLMQYFDRGTTDTKLSGYYSKKQRQLIDKYCLMGTDDVNEMVGKAGFIDRNGRYYPVRDLLENKEIEENTDIFHEDWARMYLDVIGRGGDEANPVLVLVRELGMGMVYETFDDNWDLELNLYTDHPSDIQKEHFNELNRLWLGSRLKKKGR